MHNAVVAAMIDYIGDKLKILAETVIELWRRLPLYTLRIWS